MDLTRLLSDDRPFALLRRRTPGLDDHDRVELLIGPVTTCERLADLPDEGLALVPFRQIRERGFDVRDDGTPLSVLVPEETWELPLDRVLAELPAHDVRVEDGASTWTTRSTRGSWTGCCARRSGAVRAPTS